MSVLFHWWWLDLKRRSSASGIGLPRLGSQYSFWLTDTPLPPRLVTQVALRRVPQGNSFFFTMASGSNIGIMDEAYFVGRKAILHWINTTFDLNVAKIEDTASGTGFASQRAQWAEELCSATIPPRLARNYVPAHAVDCFDDRCGGVPDRRGRLPRQAPDAEGKVGRSVRLRVCGQLQAPSAVLWAQVRCAVLSLRHHPHLHSRIFLVDSAVDKHVEVEKLCRAKYQDNLEFMQWMKRFYELNAAEDPDYDPVARRARGKGAPGSCGNAGGARAQLPRVSCPSS